MEFKSIDPIYSNKFLGHFSRFIEQYELFNKEETVAIAISGGLDSMALALGLKKIKRFGYSNRVIALHINHGTRAGQKEEQLLVRDYCEYLGIEFKSKTLSGINPERNFEKIARVKRYEAFRELAGRDTKILLAHHIDDSFEWSMLQTLRSSNIEGQIGIPLKNGNVIRPFMCVTKKQIRKFAQVYDLPFLEDPTNELNKFERNFLRNNIIAGFKDRYPKYLKHYVYRHNEIARRLGVHVIHKSHHKFKVSYGAGNVLLYSISKSIDESGLEDLIKKAVISLSDSERGVLAKQIENIKNAMIAGKIGPITLVGGIKAYIDFNMVLLTKKTHLEKELHVTKRLKLTYEQFQNYLEEYIPEPANNLDFPFLVEIRNSTLERRKFKTSLNDIYAQELRRNKKTFYPALKLLREWSKARNRHKILDLIFLSSL